MFLLDGCCISFLALMFLFAILMCFLIVGRSSTIINSTVAVMKLIPIIEPMLIALGRESSVDQPSNKQQTTQNIGKSILAGRFYN